MIIAAIVRKKAIENVDHLLRDHVLSEGNWRNGDRLLCAVAAAKDEGARLGGWRGRGGRRHRCPLRPRRGGGGAVLRCGDPGLEGARVHIGNPIAVVLGQDRCCHRVFTMIEAVVRLSESKQTDQVAA